MPGARDKLILYYDKIEEVELKKKFKLKHETDDS